MKKKIVKIFMATVAFAVVHTSCKKTQNTPAETNLKDAEASAAIFNCDIPDSLKVPAGNKLACYTYASGVQIYRVQRSTTDPNVFQWVNIAPLATVYANANYTNPVANHFAGPTWEFVKGFNKGEKVVGTKMKSMVQDPTAIPWLLLRAVDSLSSSNNKITYIQRLCTEGGVAPSTTPDETQLGQLDSIPYTTAYLFYTKK